MSSLSYRVLSKIFSLGEKIGSVGGREAAVVDRSYLGAWPRFFFLRVHAVLRQF